MRPRAFFTILSPAVALACGSTFIIMDAGKDIEADTGSEADASDAGDANEDYAWWWSQFDVRQFEGSAPPLVGEYPPANGDCFSNGGCAPIANCHGSTGFCCSGQTWCCTASGDYQCRCGPKLGCLPPQVCCFLPDAYVPECVSNYNACPGHRTPWNPTGDTE